MKTYMVYLSLVVAMAASSHAYAARSTILVDSKALTAADLSGLSGTRTVEIKIGENQPEEYTGTRSVRAEVLLTHRLGSPNAGSAHLLLTDVRNAGYVPYGHRSFVFKSAMKLDEIKNISISHKDNTFTITGNASQMTSITSGYDYKVKYLIRLKLDSKNNLLPQVEVTTLEKTKSYFEL